MLYGLLPPGEQVLIHQEVFFALSRQNNLTIRIKLSFTRQERRKTPLPAQNILITYTVYCILYCIGCIVSIDSLHF